MSEAYICGAVRCAGGRKNGRLSKIHPIDLGAIVVDALVERTGVDPEAVELDCSQSPSDAEHHSGVG